MCKNSGMESQFSKLTHPKIPLYNITEHSWKKQTPGFYHQCQHLWKCQSVGCCHPCQTHPSSQSAHFPTKLPSPSPSPSQPSPLRTWAALCPPLLFLMLKPCPTGQCSIKVPAFFIQLPQPIFKLKHRDGEKSCWVWIPCSSLQNVTEKQHLHCPTSSETWRLQEN